MASIETIREKARERQLRYRERKGGVYRHSAGCRSCGAVLSRYNPDPTCSACTPKLITHAQYLDECDPAADINTIRLVEVCQRGHDLLEHGQIVHAGGGRMTRRCGKCRKERQKAYARQRRARLRQQTA